MAGSESRIKVKRDGSIIEVSFRDRNILDEANIQQIEEEIRAIIDTEEQPRLLINFTDVDHLSSAALGKLITIHNRIRNGKKGQLRLCNIDPQILQVFVITKLNKLFEIHEDAEKARASFK
ncbi:MAG: STAS domain-containing protein [bacterium]|nr:STAS domain-containing protein [Phycisphaerales bacterium]MCE2653008.1 STAS domain-containing protein [Planctomycetaceae bacterium]